MKFHRNTRLLYLLVFFHNLIPAYVIERLFWQSRGMTVQMVVWCELIYAATIIVLEIPSGVLADLLGRRRLVVMSAVFPCLEFGLLIFSTEFWHFAAVVLLAGVSRSMYSGAQNALLYDSLAAGGNERHFEKTVGRMNALDFTAAMLAALSGGYLAFRLGFEFNYWLSLFSSAVALVCAFFLREPPRAGEAEDGQAAENWRTVASSAWRFFTRRRDVLKIVTAAALVAAATVFVDEFWQLYLDDIAFPVTLFGVASAVLSFSRILGAMACERMLRALRHATVVWLFALVFGLCALFSAVFPSVGAIAAIAAAIGAAAAIEPAALGYLHHRADASARATIESAMSLFERVMVIVLGLLFARAAAGGGVTGGYMAVGLTVAAAALALAAGTRKKA